MPQKIRGYENKKNHDLLVELVVQGNSTIDQNTEILGQLKVINSTVQAHEGRLGRVEDRIPIPAWLQSKWKVGGAGTLVIAVMSVLCRLAEKLLI